MADTKTCDSDHELFSLLHFFVTFVADSAMQTNTKTLKIKLRYIKEREKTYSMPNRRRDSESV